MRISDDIELYVRGAETLVQSWQVYADGSAGAEVRRGPGVAVAIFPHGAERSVYNNALLERGLDDFALGEAVEAMETAYAAAGIERYAAWVHVSDEPMRSHLETRDYRVDTSTLAMGMATSDVRGSATTFELASASWSDYLEYLALDEFPEGLLTGADPSAFHVVTASIAGQDVAAGIAYDFDGDCGVYNVSTVPHARGRGLGSAVTARLVEDARARGCLTASLQSTEMAERMYARVGFRDLGRFLEYVPHNRAEERSCPM